MRRLEFLGMLTLFLASIGVLGWALQHSGIYDVKGELQPYLSKIPFVGYAVGEEHLAPA